MDCRTLDVLPLLQERVAILCGRDLSNKPIVCFPATSKRERMKHEDLRRLITYLTGIPKYVIVFIIAFLSYNNARLYVYFQ